MADINPFRALPAVDTLIHDPRLAELPRALAVRAAREAVQAARERLRAGAEAGDVAADARARADATRRLKLRRVINATGIVLHTNLGRAPLAPEAARAVAEVAGGYSNAEMELESGKRGGRLDGVKGPLTELLGCEDAIAVNNNAAAVVLVLSALAQGREVIVSRGELVEIGGSFRVPDIMATSGARLVEVGTTNRTRAADYARAITPQTALLMRVHPSNFKMVGFTERPGTEELAALGVPLVEDLGSGALVPVGEEPVVRDVLQSGAALVCFSGDKLLGGPQAGIIAGRADLVQACRKHPLYRALRLDKLALAALEATLRIYLEGRLPPVLTMLAHDPRPEAEALAAALRKAGIPATAEADVGYSGGGALPGEGLPTTVVALRVPDPDALARQLRGSAPPIVARVAHDALRVDPRTLLPGEIEVVQARLLELLAAP